MCYRKLSNAKYLKAWLLVSSRTALSFPRKSQTVRPCHTPAPLGSRMSSSHTSLQGLSGSQQVRTSRVLKEQQLFTLSFPAARSAVPVAPLFSNKMHRSLPHLLWISLNPLRSVGSHGSLLSCPLSKKLQSSRLVHCHRIAHKLQAGQTPYWKRANFSFYLSFSSLPTLTDFVINLGWIYPKSRCKSLYIRKC